MVWFVLCEVGGHEIEECCESNVELACDAAVSDGQLFCDGARW